jgi:hypothetical protein
VELFNTTRNKIVTLWLEIQEKELGTKIEKLEGTWNKQAQKEIDIVLEEKVEIKLIPISLTNLNLEVNSIDPRAIAYLSKWIIDDDYEFPEEDKKSSK